MMAVNEEDDDDDAHSDCSNDTSPRHGWKQERFASRSENTARLQSHVHVSWLPS